jgi:hypothetical protein
MNVAQYRIRDGSVSTREEAYNGGSWTCNSDHSEFGIAVFNSVAYVLDLSVRAIRSTSESEECAGRWELSSAFVR